jgi:NO-binding membrane sensor protein with MHYT domain
VNLFIRANDAERGRPLPWLLGAATVFGAGVWAFHFIAELAYDPGFPVGYDAGLTAISLVAAIGAVWLGMFVVQRFAAPVLGGAMIGAGIAAMHYIGMAAVRAPAQLHWNTGYVLASIAIAMTFAAAAMRVLLRGRPWGAASWPWRYLSWRFADFVSRPWRRSLLCQIRLSRCPAMPSPQTSSPSRLLR